MLACIVVVVNIVQEVLLRFRDRDCEKRNGVWMIPSQETVLTSMQTT